MQFQPIRRTSRRDGSEVDSGAGIYQRQQVGQEVIRADFRKIDMEEDGCYV